MAERDSVHIRILAEAKAAMGELAKFSAAIGAVVLAVRKVGQVTGEMVQEYRESELASTKLTAALRATGGAVGITKGAMDEMADELSRLTGVEDDAISEAQALLVTFTKIGKEVFPDALDRAADMSAMFGQDLSSSAIQLGKALNDPIAGVGALKRIGVSFTDTQRDSIKAFVEQNDVLSAQRVILDELSAEFGGVAVAAGQNGTGALDRFKNAMGELKEQGGEFIIETGKPFLEWATKVAESLADSNTNFRLLREAMGNAYVADTASEAQKSIDLLDKEIAQRRAAMAQAGNRLTPEARKAVEAAILDLEGKRSKLQAEITALKAAEAAAAEAAAKAAKETAEKAAEDLALQNRLARVNEDFAQTEEGKRRALEESIALHEDWIKDAELTKDEEEAILAMLYAQRKELDRIKWEQRDVERSAEGEYLYREMITDSLVKELELANLLGTAYGKVYEKVEKIKDENEEAKTLAEQQVERIAAVGRAFTEAAIESGDLWEGFKAGAKEAIARALEYQAAAWTELAVASAYAQEWNKAIGYGLGAGALVAGAGAVRAMATGGIVTGPTNALIGEAGPEAVIPLSRMGRMGGTVHVHFHGPVSDRRVFEAIAINAVRKAQRRY